MGDRAIEVEGLAKSYGAVPAVRGISFTVEPGEIFALLGPNGAGKTTTVEILEGYRRRDTGRVEVLGMDPATGGRAFRERVGIVLQECGFEEHLRVGEMLRRNAGFYRAPRPVEEVLALVGLDGAAGARIRTLSGGQRRRLDLALALVGDPELLFLDEPTTGFDPAARRGAWAVVKDLARLGKTVLLTTHYMDEAQFLADRVAVIAQGTLVALGPPASIGGRTDEVSIRFAMPPGLDAADLPVPAAVAEGYAVIAPDDATRALHALTGWALARGVPLAELTVTTRSLEDVYLDLVGR